MDNTPMQYSSLVLRVNAKFLSVCAVNLQFGMPRQPSYLHLGRKLGPWTPIFNVVNLLPKAAGRRQHALPVEAAVGSAGDEEHSFVLALLAPSSGVDRDQLFPGV